jgi:hypothetical protein
MSVVLLVAVLLSPVISIRLSRPSLSVAQAAAPVEQRSGATATPVPALLRWDRPTATAAPVVAATQARFAPTRAVAAADPGLVTRGPQSLRMWSGDVIPVRPAAGEWLTQSQSSAYRWQVPLDAAGWYGNTPDCGAGITVIGGHISWNGLPGVFARLAGIGEQDRVICVDSRGQEHEFVPVDYLMATGRDSPSEWTPGWWPALVLYTCTPELNGQIIVVRFREEQQ